MPRCQPCLVATLRSDASTPVPCLQLVQGPCVSTDTACSSSLVALHAAHAGVLAAECAAAVTGGVQVNLIAQVSLPAAPVLGWRACPLAMHR